MGALSVKSIPFCWWAGLFHVFSLSIYYVLAMRANVLASSFSVHQFCVDMKTSTKQKVLTNDTPPVWVALVTINHTKGRKEVSRRPVERSNNSRNDSGRKKRDCMESERACVCAIDRNVREPNCRRFAQGSIGNVDVANERKRNVD